MADDEAWEDEEDDMFPPICDDEPEPEPELEPPEIAAAVAALCDDSELATVLRVLEALHEYRDRTVVASTSVGQVREWQLRLQFDYLIRTASGELLVPKVELRLSRDMNYTETAALAKEQEATNLYNAMHSDAIAQVMRRLAAVRLPG